MNSPQVWVGQADLIYSAHACHACANEPPWGISSAAVMQTVSGIPKSLTAAMSRDIFWEYVSAFASWTNLVGSSGLICIKWRGGQAMISSQIIVSLMTVDVPAGSPLFYRWVTLTTSHWDVSHCQSATLSTIYIQFIQLQSDFYSSSYHRKFTLTHSQRGELLWGHLGTRDLLY